MPSDVILLTGSSGLIGSAIARRLGGRFRVVGLDVKEPSQGRSNVEFVKVDLTSDESVAEALEQVRRRFGDSITSVIHLAAYYSFSGEESPLYEQVTVRGTQRLLRGVQKFRTEQFIFSSTMLVHAPCEPGERIDEDWLLEPKWPYPKSKVDTEKLLLAEHGEVPVVLMRIAGVYDDECHSIPIAHQIRRIREKELESHFYPGDTKRGQAFVHMEDLVEAIDLAVQKRGELPRETTLLIGEPETVSYGELQETFGRLIHGKEWGTHFIPKTVAKAGAWVQEHTPLPEDPFIKSWMIDMADDHYALDITRARTLLGWEPKHSLRQTAPKMVAAMVADPEGWYREHRLEWPGEERK
jgi:nucleoside-diphosphate-sugar epimerase